MRRSCTAARSRREGVRRRFTKHYKFALGALPKAYYIPDKFSLHNWLMDHPMTDTHILVKGSRGMGLESVVPFL